jgi:hypothetical protein
MKICSKCHKPEGEVEFTIKGTYCKGCSRAYSKQYNIDHRKEIQDKANIRERAKRRSLKIELKVFWKDSGVLKRKVIIRDWLNSIKAGNGCILCGDRRIPVLDFHHKDSQTKEGDISKIIDKWSPTRVMEEVLKCDVICANCHRMVHAMDTVC